MIQNKKGYYKYRVAKYTSNEDKTGENGQEGGQEKHT